MRTPKVPVRLQRHRAWDPFLCTSSQSRAVHKPCWSALWPQRSQTDHPLGGEPRRQAGVYERHWEGPRAPGVRGAQGHGWGPQGQAGPPRGYQGDQGFPEWRSSRARRVPLHTDGLAAIRCL